MATTPSASKASTVKTAAKLGVGTLMIMNIVAVVSLRGLPAEAEYGMSSAFYYLFAALVFLIPVSLVAAELAAMFPYQQGGMFRWIRRSVWKQTRISRHLAAMGGKHYMVSHCAYFWSRVSCIHRNGSCR